MEGEAAKEAGLPQRPALLSQSGRCECATKTSRSTNKFSRTGRQRTPRHIFVSSCWGTDNARRRRRTYLAAAAEHTTRTAPPVPEQVPGVRLLALSTCPHQLQIAVPSWPAVKWSHASATGRCRGTCLDLETSVVCHASS
jgi:hypothetical protein